MPAQHLVFMLFEVNYGFLLSHAIEASLCLKEETATETTAKQTISIEYLWVTCRPDGVHILFVFETFC
jgi:hypothetical protein